MRIWPLLLLLASLSCATTQATGPRTYSESAQALYEQALAELASDDFEQAILLFEQVRSRYPYSSYAALAELGVADTQFKRGRYLEAIDIYQAFLRFHPAHPRLDYASFRIGESHAKTIPSSFFLFPPPSERDQTAVRATRGALQDFLHRYPESAYVPRAQELLQEVLAVLARHEWAAARFYAKRGRWRGAALRYQALLNDYPGLGFDEQAREGLEEAMRNVEAQEAEEEGR
jgi:outer membrane protein assembly factor BamD